MRFRMEKSKGLCRQLVIPAVRDALILQSLSDSLWREVKNKAPSNNSFYAPNDHAFSPSKKNHQDEYGSINEWLAFQRAILKFREKRRYLVITDIANYYDYISYEHLRNVLADLAVTREHALDLLIYILSSMLWQPDYMPRVPVGLPQIALDAPRLLAHAFLFEIDGFLQSSAHADFARFNDDINVGVDDILHAKKILRDLDTILQTRQLRLNSGKSKILTAEEAARHFRICENRIIDYIDDKIEIKKEAGKSVTHYVDRVALWMNKLLEKETFSAGNGPKILKRILNTLRINQGQLKNGDFKKILHDWPQLRKSAFSWWVHSKDPCNGLETISNFLRHGAIVDDATHMNAAVALVSARLPLNSNTGHGINNVIKAIDRRTPWGFYSRIWILSKYGSPEEILNEIQSSSTLWSVSEPLARMVAGVYPLMVGTSHKNLYEALVEKQGGFWARPVMEFHKSLRSETEMFSAVKKFITARNPSQPNYITHSKFLMVVSALQNNDISESAKTKIRNNHNVALEDEYYKRIIRNI